MAAVATTTVATPIAIAVVPATEAPNEAATAVPIEAKIGAAAGKANKVGAAKPAKIRNMYLKYFI